MRIDGPSRSSEISRRGRRSAANGSGTFEVAEIAETAPGKPSAIAGATAAVDSLIALQEIDGEAADRREAMRWGSDVLDGLDRIRLDLLGEGVSVRRLRELRALLQNVSRANDPDLDGILSEIELRARVELAKAGIDS